MNLWIALAIMCGVVFYLVGDWYLDRMGKNIRRDFEREFPDRCCYCSFIEWGINSGNEEPDARPKPHNCKENMRRWRND